MITRRSILAAPFVLAASRVRADRPYDVALVLATDVSHSILAQDYALQKEGIVSGLTSENMALLLDQGRRYLFQYMEWSGAQSQAFSGWYAIETFDDALAFAGMVHGWQRSSRDGETAIAQALRASRVALGALPSPALRRVIDVSFDGHDNASPRSGIGGSIALRETADLLAAEDVVVNGLLIPEAGRGMDLEAYFQSTIAGPRSFFVTVPEPQYFGQMFLRKLIEEVS